ncbi:hypothetical protein DFH11DRAFT_394730 [Phellopilus nigrolimitatus]|nr:hypothetical protein DFH11DRAFT_394730 [Phellopilus nigrolimitatus]
MSHISTLLATTQKPASQSEPAETKLKPRPAFSGTQETKPDPNSQEKEESASDVNLCTSGAAKAGIEQREDEDPEGASNETLSHRSFQNTSRHPTHWYLDGSVVIHMDSTLFKVHRSTLVRKSTYFRDLFEKELLQPDVKKLNGCPVVEVEGNAKDFAILLDAIDDFAGLLVKMNTFETIASILRTSTDFAFTSLRAWAAGKLQDMWPEDISGVTPVPRPYATETVVLARECDVPKVLKSALYELVRTEGFGLYDEDEEEAGDGGDANRGDYEPAKSEGDEDEDTLSSPPNSAQNTHTITKSYLSRADVITLTYAREWLVGRWIAIATRPPVVTLPTTQSPCEHRSSDAKHWARTVLESGLFSERIYDPIVGLGVLANVELHEPDGAEVRKGKDGHWYLKSSNSGETDLGFLYVDWMKESSCKSCAIIAKDKWKKERNKMWKGLDEIFELA